MFVRPSVLLTIVFVALVSFAQDVSFPLPRSGSFSVDSSLAGTVVDGAGHPISGARVEILDLYTGRTVSTAYTFPNGGFEFSRIPRDRYEIVASAGVNEARSRVDLAMDRNITFRLSGGNSDQGSRSHTVSVAEMKVPGKARKIFQKALDAFRKARIDDAFGLVQKALGVYPDYAQALTLRGVLNMRKGDTSQAQPDLEKAVELDHADDMGLAALGALYNTQKRFDEAIQVLERGIILNPTSWQSQMELARAQVGKKDADAALRTLAKAEKYIPPQIYFPHLVRAEAFIIKENYQAAVAELDAYLKYEPTGTNAEAAKRTLAQLQSLIASAAIK